MFGICKIDFFQRLLWPGTLSTLLLRPMVAEALGRITGSSLFLLQACKCSSFECVVSDGIEAISEAICLSVCCLFLCVLGSLQTAEEAAAAKASLAQSARHAGESVDTRISACGSDTNCVSVSTLALFAGH